MAMEQAFNQHWLNVKNEMGQIQADVVGDPMNPTQYTAAEWAGVSMNVGLRLWGLWAEGFSVLADTSGDFVPAGATHEVTEKTKQMDDGSVVKTTTTTLKAQPN